MTESMPQVTRLIRKYRQSGELRAIDYRAGDLGGCIQTRTYGRMSG